MTSSISPATKADHFLKQMRNIDYLDIENEFFSSDHLYYADDGYKGFSDYSVVWRGIQ